MRNAGNQEHDFPRRLGRPATAALLAAGYTRLEQLTSVTAKEVLALHGMGPKGIRILREELAAQGKAFEGEKGGVGGVASLREKGWWLVATRNGSRETESRMPVIQSNANSRQLSSNSRYCTIARYCYC